MQGVFVFNCILSLICCAWVMLLPQEARKPKTICLSSSILYVHGRSRLFFLLSHFGVICLLNRSKSHSRVQQASLRLGQEKHKRCSSKHNSHPCNALIFPQLFGMSGENTHCVFTNHKQQATGYFSHSGQICKNLWEWVSACTVPEWSASIMAPCNIGLSKVREVFNEFKVPIQYYTVLRGKHPWFIPSPSCLLAHDFASIVLPWNGRNEKSLYWTST